MTGWSVFDYIVVVVLLGAFAIGWARGFVMILTGFVSFLVTMVIAGRYTPLGVDWLNRTWQVEARLAVMLERRIQLPPEADQIPASAVPWEKALLWLQNVPIPEAYRQTLAEQIAQWSQGAGSQTASQYIVSQLASGILSALVFTVLAVILGWVLALIARFVSNVVEQIPLVGTVNRLLGSLALLLQTALILAAAVAVFLPMIATWGMPWVNTATEGSVMEPYLIRLFDWFKQAALGAGQGFSLMNR